MTQSGRIHHHRHAVQFYGNDENLVSTVAGFVSEGLVAGHPAVLIATPSHRAAILTELGRRDIDTHKAVHIGDLVCLDAEDALATFMAGDTPDPYAFTTNVGDILEQTIRGRLRVPVHAYGEMVDVLWKRGNVDAAIKLEILWNQLAQSHAFELLCGYSMGNFFKKTDHFRQVCEQHTEVIMDTPSLPFERRAVPRPS